jgi:4-oxalocrotonate tautomerase
VPHVNIKHFPVALSDEQQARLVTVITRVVQDTFECDEGVISIALEPVEAAAWTELVYTPEIVARGELLRKAPAY